ncbi:hypothetical protein SGADD02_00780 [Streptococcus gallolyticus]|uniref:Uncharacterized protein n=1 Tax=Streptococcus gallolyticus TaxID=315405 RepID=A0A139QR22_9STRE|nr:hypothetical protein HMPREF9352_0896 [Streptococcus gallolyticus subsp. gallolyticus TX20005]KXT71532.1 hypothetical protein SGADD02_00780 [Streptococcus gallolyticus]KXU04793.1 hypothetical protein SGADD03_01776 [Streptococcus gallolyticus]
MIRLENGKTLFAMPKATCFKLMIFSSKKVKGDDYDKINSPCWNKF